MEIDFNFVSDLGVTKCTVVSEKWNTTCNEFVVIKVEVTSTSKNYSILKADNVEQPIKVSVGWSESLRINRVLNK